MNDLIPRVDIFFQNPYLHQLGISNQMNGCAYFYCTTQTDTLYRISALFYSERGKERSWKRILLS